MTGQGSLLRQITPNKRPSGRLSEGTETKQFSCGIRPRLIGSAEPRCPHLLRLCGDKRPDTFLGGFHGGLVLLGSVGHALGANNLDVADPQEAQYRR